MNVKNHSYFYSLEFEGLNCFKDKQFLDLSDGNGNFAKWTIILGDNGTGKTTLLRLLDFEFPKTNDYQGNTSQESLLRYKFLGLYDTISLKIINESIKELSAINDFQKNNKASFLLSYGATRRMSKNTGINFYSLPSSLLDDTVELINAEEWFLQKSIKSLLANEKAKDKYYNEFELVKNLLIDFLPDVNDIKIKDIDEENSDILVEVNTLYGWVNLKDLSYGYQTLTALIVDIAAKMMNQYVNSPNPLSEPVIILIDEIDLHLHPKWQRIVLDKMSEHFPNAQFIVTAHSPLIVQAAQDKNANIVVCRKEGDRVVIDNNPDNVKGWRIDQILTSDLFEVESPRSKKTQENIDEYLVLQGKSNLSRKEKAQLENIIPNVENVFQEKKTNLDDKLAKFAEKYLK